METAFNRSSYARQRSMWRKLRMMKSQSPPWMRAALSRRQRLRTKSLVKSMSWTTPLISRSNPQSSIVWKPLMAYLKSECRQTRITQRWDVSLLNFFRKRLSSIRRTRGTCRKSSTCKTRRTSCRCNLHNQEQLPQVESHLICMLMDLELCLGLRAFLTYQSLLPLEKQNQITMVRYKSSQDVNQ